MTLVERLRQLVEALPSDDCSVTITRADLISLLEEDAGSAASPRDMTVEEVARETGRAPSTRKSSIEADRVLYLAFIGVLAAVAALVLPLLALVN